MWIKWLLKQKMTIMTAGGSLFNNFSFDCRVNIHLIDWKYIHCVRDCANEEKDRDEERACMESCCVARRRRQTLFEVVRSYAVSVAVCRLAHKSESFDTECTRYLHGKQHGISTGVSRINERVWLAIFELRLSVARATVPSNLLTLCIPRAYYFHVVFVLSLIFFCLFCFPKINHHDRVAWRRRMRKRMAMAFTNSIHK